MTYRYRRKQSLAPPGQLELPLDYSRSELDALFRNLLPSKARRSRRWQDRLGTYPAIPGPLGIAQVSCGSDSQNNRVRQRFLLTPTLSTLISNVNGKRWRSHGSALSPFNCGALAKSGESSPHVGRGSPRRLPAHPLVRHKRRARLPSLSVRCRVCLCRAPAVQVQGL